MNFLGVCPNSGASRNGAGKNLEQFYREPTALSSGRKYSSTLYRFETSLTRSHAPTRTWLSIQNNATPEFCVDAIDGDIPILIGLEVMWNYKPILNFNEDILQCELLQGLLRVLYTPGQSFLLTKAVSNFFTKPEPTRLHSHFITFCWNTIRTTTTNQPDKSYSGESTDAEEYHRCMRKLQVVFIHALPIRSCSSIW